MERADFLFELGSEELPPKSLQRLSQALESGVKQGLEEAGLSFGAITSYATPRRLALWVQGLQRQQADRKQQRRGPAEQSAFDASGEPTRALQGFARSCGVEIDQLERIETPKGVWMGVTLEQPGQSASAILPEILSTALDRLPIPKRMRWGAADAEFLRPVHWVVALLGERVVPLTLFGIESGNLSRGHRFHHPTAMTITDAASYAEQLQQTGMVVARFDQRRQIIEEQVLTAATEIGGTALLDPELLDEVTALVEWPQALVGSFDEQFLEVPQEALIASMQGHQKFFPVVDKSGRLLPHFITISNIESHDPTVVRQGNERVIRPRLADAAFFWKQDRSRPLSVHLEPLKQVVYQGQLGSLHEKSERVATLAATIAERLGFDQDSARRAATLGKCDLLTEMVKEFPELQGTMGRYYAEHDGESGAVAIALEEQYMPRHAGAALPQSPTGMALALAERIDTLVGIFGIGLIPSGDKDPFSLRRAALGVLRILVEQRCPLDLLELLQQAASGYGDRIDPDATTQVFDYTLERLRGYYQQQQIPAAIFDAVAAVRPPAPLDFDQRIQALRPFVEREEAASLAAANKRIHNLLKKSDESVPSKIDRSLFDDPQEQTLATALDQIQAQLDDHLASGHYDLALEQLSSLRPIVDRYFDAVLVMAEESAVRLNRLALLAQLRQQFLRVADISLLQFP